MRGRWFALVGMAVLLCSCASREQAAPTAPVGPALAITSSAFEEGGMIPDRYTCSGENVSPPLSWSGLPDGVASLALVADDPDAPIGVWVHWVWYDLPPTMSQLPEAIAMGQPLPEGGKQGLSDFRKAGYGGPCPPSGTHRYYFTLYALDRSLGLPEGATKKELLKAMEGHILARGQLMGRYKKP